MTDVAWKNTSREKGRTAVSVCGVAFAVLLILLVRGIYEGIQQDATEYLRSVNPDIWVSQAGTPGDMFHSASVLPRDVGAELADVEGVKRADPLLGRPIVFKAHGRDVDFFLLGIDTNGGVGAPTNIVSGRQLEAPGEIILDEVFANNSGLSRGDTIVVKGRELRVVGLASGGNTFISQFAWANISDVAAMVGAKDVVSFFLVFTDGRASPAEVARGINESVPRAQALTEADFLRRSTADLEEGFLPIVWLIMAIAFVVGTIIVGFTIYTATMEKRREYGILKALGFSNRNLLGIMSRQTTVSACLGFVAGVLLSFVLQQLLHLFVPAFSGRFVPADLLVVGVAAFVMSAISTLLPLRPVARLDPSEVFRV